MASFRANWYQNKKFNSLCDQIIRLGNLCRVHERFMTYFNQLHPWCIIRPLPNLKSIVVARFRRRGDAEAHLQILQRTIANATYEIIFDVTPEPADETNEMKLPQPNPHLN